MSYRVFVDDHFHFMDESERYQYGEFETADQAIAACRLIVDRFLIGNFKPGMSSESLYDTYTLGGEDPFIKSDFEDYLSVNFSAWKYARLRCDVLAGL